MVTRKQQREADRIRQLRQPPDLQALVEAHGTWDQIPPEAWAQFDRAMVEWKDHMRHGDFPPMPLGPIDRSCR